MQNQKASSESYWIDAFEYGMRKLDRLVAEFPEVYRLMRQTDIDRTYSMPKSYVSYRKPRRLSDKQREQAKALVKKNNPNWKPGDAFDTNILDQLDGTLGGVDFKA